MQRPGDVCRERSDVDRLAERFWSKVNKDGPVHPVLGTRCWLWTASTDGRYGSFSVAKGGKWSQAKAHRAVWDVIGEPLADGENSLHRCDVPRCVRPDHLFKGTQRDNLVDAGRKGKMARDVYGERNPRVKLTQAQVDTIRAAGLSSADSLAIRFGITKQYSRMIVRGYRRTQGA